MKSSTHTIAFNVASGRLLVALAFVLIAQPRRVCGNNLELLKLVAVQNRVNVESITTWQGELDVKETKTAGNSIRQYESAVKFAYDRGLNSKRWNWDCQKFTVSDGGEKLPGPEIGLMSGMIKDEAFYRLGPVPASYQGRRVVAVDGKNRFSHGPESVDFDPMYCFTDFGELAHERFGALYEIAKTDKTAAWTVTRNGELVSIISRSVLSNGAEIINNYTVDLSQGANIVRYDSSDPTGEYYLEYDYEFVKGAWVPSNHIYKTLQKGRTFLREAAWTKNAVNYPSDESLFTIESLGVSDGDKVKDNRSGTEYFIGGVQAAREQAGLAPRKPSYARYVFILANVFAALILAIVVLRRRAIATHGM